MSAIRPLTDDRPAPASGSDPRLTAALEEYRAALEAGQVPDRAAFLERYADLGEALAECLAGLELVHAAAPALSGTDVFMPSDPPAEPLIEPLGDFRIVREIGRGGMGVVYQAEQVSLGRRVALKVLPFAATMDARQLQRFKNEAQAAAQLHHTNIVPVYFVGCERGVHFYAMQYIEGHTLAELIAELRGQPADAKPKPQPSPRRHSDVTVDAAAGQAIDSVAPSVVPETKPIAGLSTIRSTKDATYFRAVAELAIQAAEALDYAHQQGVVHRDIKPANLLVEGTGRLWVTDFGLAQIQGNTRLTMTGDLVGTLRYMSPEQALAKRVVVDHRTDVYSLGATLYEMLTLEPAYVASDRQELLRQIAFEEPRPLRRLNRVIPMELETIVLKAMEKNPADRFAAAQELADDMRRFLLDQPIRARRPTRAQRLRKWAFRHRRAVAFATSILALAMVTLAASALYAMTAYRAEKEERHKAEAAESKAKEAERMESEQRHAAEKERDQAELRAYLADMRLARQEWEQGAVGATRQLLEAHRPRQGRSDRRGWEWYYLQSLCHADLATFEEDNTGVTNTVSSGGARTLSWGPCGLLAWAGADDGTVWVWDKAAGRKPLALRGHSSSVFLLAWSPDGRRLASASAMDQTVRVWDAQRRTSIRVLHVRGLRSLAWSPDGERLAVARQSIPPGDVTVWDPEEGKERFTIGPMMNPKITWSPDGTRLAMTNDQLNCQLWDAETGKRTLTIDSGSKDSFPERDWSAWSPDGKRLLLPMGDGTCTIFDATTGEKALSFGGGVPVTAVAWSPDGKRLATTDRSATKVWDPVTGKELFSATHGSGFAVPIWSFDSHRLAIASGQMIAVWDALVARQVLTLRGHLARITHLGWSPDGQQLASVDERLTVKIWDATQPQGRKVLGRHEGCSVHWSPDGQRMATLADDSVKIWDVAARNSPRTLPGPKAFLRRLAWSPDSRRLAFADRERSDIDTVVRIFDAVTGMELRLWPAPAPQGAHRVSGTPSLDWSPDGHWIASAHCDGTIRIRDVETGQEVTALGNPTAALTEVAWGPNGRLLATQGSQLIFLWDTSTWQPLGPLGRALWIRRGCWSPDGHLLAAPWQSSIKVWEPATGREVFTLRVEDANSMAWSPNGQRLASLSRELLQVWDVPTGEEVLRLPACDAGDLAWAPDGRRLAAANSDGTITILDASAGYTIPPMRARDEDPSLRNSLVDQLKSVVNPLRQMSRFTEAESRLRRAVAVQGRLVQEFPRSRHYLSELGRLHRELGELLEQADRDTEAEVAYRQAVALHQKLCDDSPRNRSDRDAMELSREQLAKMLLRGKRFALAAHEYRQIITSAEEHRWKLREYNWGDEEKINAFVWLLVTCPDAAVRNPAEAVQLAEKGLAYPGSQKNGNYWNTLGVARYYAGNWTGSIAALAKSIQLRGGGDSFDFFILAMAHRQLGDTEQPQQWYDRAVQWMEKHQPQDEELCRFRGEAAALLKIEATPGEKPE